MSLEREISYLMPAEQQDFIQELRQEQQNLVEAELRLTKAAFQIKAIEGPHKTLRDFIIRAELAGTLEPGTALKLGCYHKLDGALDPQWQATYEKGNKA